jgi:O-antigen/teichoic acid export membrane protein
MLKPKAFTGKKLLIKNIGFNFIIHGVTVLVALVTVPHIIKAIGIERFGVLTIMWSVIGYSSLLDLGLGRALTQVVSHKLGAGREDEVAPAVWTSLSVIAVLSLLAAGLMLLASETIVRLIRVSPKDFDEVLRSMRLLSLSLPFLIAMMGLKAVLESYQKFNIISALRLPVLFFNYIAPLMIFPFCKSLFALILVLVIGRVITAFGYFAAVARLVPGFAGSRKFCRAQLGLLVNVGRWTTVSNLLSPLMSYMDRFLISILLTSQVVAYYATPYDALTKMSIVPSAIMSVMFPAITAGLAGRDRTRARLLYGKSLQSIFLILLLPVLTVVLFAKPLLALWIDAEFARRSHVLSALLALGFFLTSLNTVPFAAIQGSGRADVTAKLHMLELPVYLAALYFGIHHFGIIGAPLALLVRITLDSVLLHALALKYLADPKQAESAQQEEQPVREALVTAVS